MDTMNPQERELLQDFLRQLVEIRGVHKNPEAQALVARAFAQQPDAPYLLVQRALLLEQALSSAKAQIAELQNAQAGSSGRSFLSGANVWGRSAEQAFQRPTLSVDGRPIPANPERPSSTPSPATAPMSPFGSFLGQAAATAAGVAGGAFLFQGLESLLGAHGAPMEHPADHHQLREAALDEQAPPRGDGDYQDITSDIDWDDFDSSDDSSI
jgi:hypothetical protein